MIPVGILAAAHPRAGSGGNPALKAKLVSWWSFDDTLNDLHGSNNFTNSSPFSYSTTAKKGKSYQPGRSLSAPNNSSTPHPLNVGGALFGWLDLTSTTPTQVFCRGSGGIRGETLFMYAGLGDPGGYFIGTRPNTGTNTGIRETSTGILASTGGYRFLGLQIDPVLGELQLWVNGALAHSLDVSSSIGTGNATPGGFYAGYAYNNNPPPGLCDEYGATNQALTQAEWEWLYNGGNGRAYSEL